MSEPYKRCTYSKHYFVSYGGNTMSSSRHPEHQAKCTLVVCLLNYILIKFHLYHCRIYGLWSPIRYFHQEGWRLFHEWKLGCTGSFKVGMFIVSRLCFVILVLLVWSYTFSSQEMLILNSWFGMLTLDAFPDATLFI